VVHVDDELVTPYEVDPILDVTLKILYSDGCGRMFVMNVASKAAVQIPVRKTH
jgi:hypothetical protein